LTTEQYWDIRLLGGLRLWHNEKEIRAFQHRKAGTLLAYLALYKDRPHDRDTLIGMLWPLVELEAGRNSLNVALSRIRQRLEGKELLRTERYQLQLDPQALKTDVGEFEAALQRARKLAPQDPRHREQLERAIATYQGPLLPTFDEPWVLGERQRLQEAYLEALNQLAQLQAGERRWDDAIASCHQALHHDPLREETHQTLLRIYQEAGRVTAARTHFQELERLFRRELNIAPAKATVALLSPSAAPSPAPPVPAPPAAPRPSNLPLELTRFFGRESEQKELQYLRARGSRLLTLVGVGGIGKTRLAQELARRAEEQGEQVYWVPLADTPSESRLWEVLLTTLRRQGKTPPPQLIPTDADQAQEEVIALLLQEPCLLVLDNLEHLQEEHLQGFIKTLLRRVRGLSLLCTSRRRLALSGEQVYVVEPLPLPNSQSEEQAWLCPSLQLLQDRVSLLRPELSLQGSPLEPLSQLCRRLDGLPLALEMAAARLATLSPRAVLQKLTESIDVLVSAHTDVHPRHLSLEATFIWSYQLLSGDAQWFLRLLSVFRGGCTLEAAEAVSGSAALLAPLTELVDASLVVRDGQGESIRYRLLESIRQFAHSLLSDHERATLCQQHAHYFSQDSSKEEHENQVLALQWLQSAPPDIPRELRLAESLFFYWMRQGTLQFNFATLERSLERLLQLESIPSTYNPLLIEITLHYARTSNFTKAFELINTIDRKCDYSYLFVESKAKAFAFLGNIEKSLNYYTELVKDNDISTFRYILACVNMSSLHTRIAQHQEALELLQRAKHLNAREENNQRLEAIILCSLSLVHGRLGAHEVGLAHYQESTVLFEALGDQHSLLRIGWYEAELYRRAGNWERATVLYRKSAQDCHSLAETDLLIEGLIGLVYCHAHSDNHLCALMLLGGIQAIITATGCLRTRSEQEELDELATRVRTAFAGDAVAAFTMGQALKPDQVVKLALEAA
jgi:predicted ATPase/DNA-binding SARP family transcriptional activator